MNVTKLHSTILSIVLLCGSIGLNAQTLQRWNSGYEDFDIYNPAAAYDRNDLLCIYGRYTFYWGSSTAGLHTGGMTGNGLGTRTPVGTEPFDAAAKTNVRLKTGQMLARASYSGQSFFRQIRLGAGYAYGWKLGEHTLTASALVNIGGEIVDFDKMSFSASQKGKSFSLIPELDLGFQWRHGSLALGCSALNLLGIPMKVDGAALIQYPRCFFINFAYDFHIQAANLQISPFALLGFCQGGTTDIGVYLNWMDKLNFSYSFRALDTAHIFNLGTVIAGHYGIRVGYNFHNLHSHSAVFAMLEYSF